MSSEGSSIKDLTAETSSLELLVFTMHKSLDKASLATPVSDDIDKTLHAIASTKVKEKDSLIEVDT